MKIFMVTSAICPPWDNALKNIIVPLVINSKHQFYLPTLVREDEDLFQADNVVFKNIYTSKNTKLSFLQKLRIFWFLLTKTKDIDIYHLWFDPTPSVALVMKIIYKLKRKKTVHTVLNTFNDIKRLKRTFFADMMVVSSNLMKVRFLKQGINNVVKINPSIDIDRYRLRDCSSIKHRLGITEGPVVLYAGNYRRPLGVDVIEEAIPVVLKTLPELKIILACRIENTQELRREEEFKDKIKRLGLHKSVIFLHTVKDMVELLSLTTICIYPMVESKDKCEIPLILIESLAMEKPLIISDIRPINEIFVSRDAGLKVPPGDPVALANAIVNLIRDEDIRRDMGRKGRESIERYFNASSVAKEYDKLYEELMKLNNS